MWRAGITLSTIGTGGGSARILRNLAEQSGGRYYDAGDATKIPDIFLKETIRTAGEKIVEERFQPVPSAPSEILRGLDAGRLPFLSGYNATTAKGTATVALLTGRDDPLLAQWQYGLGRAAAWMSDTRQQWATDWIGTEAFGTMTAQLVSWTLPPQDDQGIEVRFAPGRDGELGVQVSSLDDEGTPRNFYRTVVRLVGPDLEAVKIPLVQDGPGHYVGTVRADDPGAYLVRVAQTRDGSDPASRTLGLVSPAAEEFRQLGVDREALEGFAAAGGGRVLEPDATGADAGEAAAAIWRHDIAASSFPTPIWPLLLLLAMALVPVDIGVRRVAVSRSDFARARAWAARRLGIGRPAPDVVPGLATLRAARDRTARRTERTAAGAPPATGRTATSTEATPPAQATVPASARPAPSASVPAGTTETLAERLARQRRRR
jgi:hypothetical protein